MVRTGSSPSSTIRYAPFLYNFYTFTKADRFQFISLAQSTTASGCLPLSVKHSSSLGHPALPLPSSNEFYNSSKEILDAIEDNDLASEEEEDSYETVVVANPTTDAILPNHTQHNAACGGSVITGLGKLHLHSLSRGYSLIFRSAFALSSQSRRDHRFLLRWSRSSLYDAKCPERTI